MALNMSAAFNIGVNVQGGQQVAALTQSMRQLGQQGETSSRQIANAMRQLPAQFQDVAVSLAGGQNPLMVLLQQGSQITSSFGGLGNALRGVATLFTPVSVGIGSIALALGGVAIAAVQGYKEMREFSRTLELTNNFAGQTAGSFLELGRAISQATGGSETRMRQLIAGAAGTGDFGPETMRQAATAMAQLQRVSGQTSEEVVKVFAGMSDGVSDWAEKANRAYNFLSVEQYRYIRTLEEQGRAEDAVRVALEAFNESFSQRSVNIGTIERAYNKLAGALSVLKNELMSIGRDSTLQESLVEHQRKLELLLSRPPGSGAMSRFKGQWEEEVKNTRAAVAALQEQIDAETNKARAQADAAAAARAAIKQEQEAERERKRIATEEEQRADQRRAMLAGIGDEIFKLYNGEREFLILQGQRLGMSEKELGFLGRLYDERQRLKDLVEAEEQARKKAVEEQRARDKAALQQFQERVKLEEEGKRVYQDTRTEVEKLAQTEERLAYLLDQGVISWDTYSRAIFKANEEFDDLQKTGYNAMDELRKAIEGWGKSSAQAIADFAMGGKASFKDFAQAVIRDMITMAAYMTITRPLFGALAGMLPGGTAAPTGGGHFGGISVPKDFALGGIMTSEGAMPLKRYARGGIATSPQLAIFGEGSMPEAYVPLPDGRSIPVTMQGGSGTSVVVNVSVEGGSAQVQEDRGAGELGRLIAGAVKAELINQKRPGGLLAA